MPRLGRTGTREVVTAVGELVQLDVFGQQLPVAVACPESRRRGVVRSDHHGDRRGQPFRWRIVQDIGEIAVRRHVVVAVRGADMLGAFRVQLAELGVAAVGGQPRGNLGVAAFPEFGDGSAPVGSGTEQLRAEEHPRHSGPGSLQPPGRLNCEGGAGGVSPQQHSGQSAPVDLGNHAVDNLGQRRERLSCGPDIVTRQFDGIHRKTATAQRLRHRLEVHRVAAGIRKAHEGAVLATVRFRPI